jgi:hypothetical protein
MKLGQWDLAREDGWHLAMLAGHPRGREVRHGASPRHVLLTADGTLQRQAGLPVR